MKVGADLDVKKGSLIQVVADGILLYSYQLTENREAVISLMIDIKKVEGEGKPDDVPRI